MGLWSVAGNRILVITPHPEPSLHVDVNRTTVPPGGSVNIIAIYTDDTGHPVPEQNLTISLTNDTGVEIAFLRVPVGDEGFTIIPFRFDPELLPGDYTITCSAGNLSVTITITVTGFDPGIQPSIMALAIVPINPAPGVPQPTSSSTLGVYVEVQNDSGHELVFTYLWSVNHLHAGSDHPELHHSHFAVGDVVSVMVTVTDRTGYHIHQRTSDPVTILNTLPEIRDAVIHPLSPLTADNLTVVLDFFDHDGHAQDGSIFNWVVNRGLGHGWEPVSVHGPTIPHHHTGRDEQWKCTITPSDGLSFGESFTTDPVTIGNSAPVAVLSSPSLDHRYHIGEEIEFDSRSSFDPDGDNLVHIWIVGGREIRSSRFFQTFGEGDHAVEYVLTDGSQLVRRSIILTVIPEPRPLISIVPEDSYLSNLDERGRGCIGRELTYTVFVWNKGQVEANATVVFTLVPPRGSEQEGTAQKAAHGTSQETSPEATQGTVLGERSVRVSPGRFDTTFIMWRPETAGEYVIHVHIRDSDPDGIDPDSDRVSAVVMVDPPPVTPGEGVPDSAVVVAGTVGLGVVAFSIAGYEPWKYRFFLFLAPLYTKLDHDDRMDNENRSKILGFILGMEEGKREAGGQPGVCYSTIKKKLQFSNGALAYHLSVLEREGDIRSEKVGKFRLYFPTKVRKPKTIFLERLTALQQRLVDEIRKHTEVSQKRLVRSMKESQQVISYNLNRLEKKGIVFMTRRGNRSYCSLNPEYLTEQ